MTVAFEIRWPISSKKNSNNNYKYYSPFITIWHVDPEKDGTDDSCGWFIRARHADQGKFEKVRKEFQFNFKHNYWFDKNGRQQFSTQGILLNMFTAAAWIHFDQNRKKIDRFFRKHLFDILYFAENPTDCGGDTITRKYGEKINEETMDRMAGMVYSFIVRKTLKWYKHPRWHIHHWKIQFHPWQQLVRRYWTKCSVCGKRGFKGAACGDWSGTKKWHMECDQSRKTSH